METYTYLIDPEDCFFCLGQTDLYPIDIIDGISNKLEVTYTKNANHTKIYFSLGRKFYKYLQNYTGKRLILFKDTGAPKFKKILVLQDFYIKTESVINDNSTADQVFFVTLESSSSQIFSII